MSSKLYIDRGSVVVVEAFVLLGPGAEGVGEADKRRRPVRVRVHPPSNAARGVTGRRRATRVRGSAADCHRAEPNTDVRPRDRQRAPRATAATAAGIRILS